MKQLLLVLLAMIALNARPAQAGFFDGVADVLSFGQVGRERDRTRAQMHRILALEKKLAAEKLKAQKIESLLEQNAIIGANLAANKQVLQGLNMLSELVESLEGFIAQVYTILFQAKVESEVFTKLIVLQQQQIVDFLNSYKKGDPENTGILSVERIILNFNYQVEHFPKNELNDTIVDEMIYQSMINNSMVVEVLKETTTLVQNRIKIQEAEIDRNNRRKEELKNPPKPNPNPKK